MSGAGFDADQRGVVGALAILKRCPVLEAVAGNDAVVVVAGEDHGGGIVDAFAQAMKR